MSAIATTRAGRCRWSAGTLFTVLALLWGTSSLRYFTPQVEFGF